MLAVPAATPVTKPFDVELFTVATGVLSEVQPAEVVTSE
jgi:hypothetical protein